VLNVNNETGDREIGPLGSDNDDARGFSVSAYCVYLSRVLWPINEPKAPVANVCYHAVIGTNIPVNRMAKKPGGEYTRMASLNGEVSYVNEDVDRFQSSES
jgi:hypothetical protein